MTNCNSNSPSTTEKSCNYEGMVQDDGQLTGEQLFWKRAENLLSSRFNFGSKDRQKTQRAEFY